MLSQLSYASIAAPQISYSRRIALFPTTYNIIPHLFPDVNSFLKFFRNFFHFSYQHPECGKHFVLCVLVFVLPCKQRCAVLFGKDILLVAEVTGDLNLTLLRKDVIDLSLSDGDQCTRRTFP